MRKLLLSILLLLVVVLPLQAAPRPKRPLPHLKELQRMTARFAPTELVVDTRALAPGDRQALVKLIEAARVIDDIYLTQMWSGNHALYKKLQADHTPLGRARLHYFWINKCPWSRLDDHIAFLPGVPATKPAGANFYPEDMTREQFEQWVNTLSPVDREEAKGFFTIVRRGPDRRLYQVGYNVAYRAELERAASLLRSAATLTPNASLRKFLTSRAEAFLSNNYYQSDVDWMDLDAPLDVTIGPYETYNDDLFGYKAAFEAFINLRDDAESTKLKAFSRHLQELENNLPVDPRYRNPKIGGAAPIRVVNQIMCTGDANHGVQTAAYNLPNDERVILQKGSKRVMLKNVQEAKFRRVLVPIAGRVLARDEQKYVSFDSFFTHILAHELMHGLGPHDLRINGVKTSPRKELKDLYSAIEEAKADMTGLFALGYLLDHSKRLGMTAILKADGDASRRLYTTFLASAFRSLRFGLHEAHGRGIALQLNYMLDRGAFVVRPDGTFAVDYRKMPGAVRDLTHDLLTIEAQGDYAAAKQLLDRLAVMRPPVKKALARLQSIPVDIEPIFVTADRLAPAKAR